MGEGRGGIAVDGYPCRWRATDPFTLVGQIAQVNDLQKARVAS